jgi:glycine/D-amino acid oxidase-like deaminating enzyme/nitrite reductase/ring-hydroxylating ferredoxin subunit
MLYNLYLFMKDMDTKNNILRDGALKSAWQDNLPVNDQNSQQDKAGQIFDAVVIGGGITGLTAALLLQKSGKQTLVAEANTIGFGTTGGTSAHINTFADTSYKETESSFGEKGAQLFRDAIINGFETIKSNINTYSIACDYEEKPGYIYAEDGAQAKLLDDIYEGTVKVGVAAEYVDAVPTPAPYVKAARFDNQAQFHPLKYLQGLQTAYINAGGVILENTLVKSVANEDELHIVQSDGINIKAKNVIYATHLPPNINVFNFRCAPYRSYVIAVTLTSGAYPDALVYDMQEPYHYVRSHTINGEELLIVGGNDHKTAHEDPEQAFADLEKYVRQYYDVAAIRYKWSSQYYVPVDGLPYVGQLPMAADGIYCATGFNGNGMMLGSVSGRILADLVLGQENPYAELFSTSRLKPIDGFKEFVKENADVAYHFVKDRIGIAEADSLKELQPGTGKVVEVDGEMIAAYRDDKGEIHALSPVCTHAKCIVNWNSEEKSWDCPCHGARYDIDGQVLTGPATKALAAIK